jgi:ribA/ribD-fused uncharacterized protein
MKIAVFKGGYRFLSNFYYAPVVFDGEEYRTIEHAYQAAKTLDKSEREMIRNSRTPGRAKTLGKEMATLRKDWQDIKISIMTDLVNQKFTKHSDLKEKLLATGDAEIQEGNWWGDTFWGVDIDTGVGENNLGKILMKVREHLKGLI